jgi:hypothetical protein
VFFPDDTGDMPAVAMNGTAVGYALAGTSFYRDMPAGRYHLSVASYGLDLDQSQDLASGTRLRRFNPAESGLLASPAML